MFTAALNSFSKDRGGKKSQKSVIKKGIFGHTHSFSMVTTTLARTATAATAATATRRGWSDYIMPPVNI